MLNLDISYLIGLGVGCILTALFNEMTREHETLGAILSLSFALILGVAIGGILKLLL